MLLIVTITLRYEDFVRFPEIQITTKLKYDRHHNSTAMNVKSGQVKGTDDVQLDCHILIMRLFLLAGAAFIGLLRIR
jgi:hypothetical protein